MIVQEQKRAFGVFPSARKLEQAIIELQAANYPMEKVSIIGKDHEQETLAGEKQVSHHIGKQNVNATKAVGDTLTATTWGSLLLGLSGLAIPGLGAVLAAGSVGVALVASMAGVAVGAAASQNVVKALADLGIPEDRARFYSDRLQQSYYLIIVDGTEPEISLAETILRQGGIQNLTIYDLPQHEMVS
jgi:uncharacterized membrane protein